MCPGQDADLVGHRESFMWIVGDEHRGRAARLMMSRTSSDRRVAQVDVEVGERLVQQQQSGRARARVQARRAAAVRRRFRVDMSSDAERRPAGRAPPRAPRALSPAWRAARSDIAGHRQVREQRVVLENHATRRDRGDSILPRPETTLPARRISPSWMPSKRLCRRSTVVLPQPLGPSRQRWRRGRAKSSSLAPLPGRHTRDAGFRLPAAWAIIVIVSLIRRNEALEFKDLGPAPGGGSAGRGSTRAAGVFVGASFLGGASDAWRHLGATALPRYVGNTAMLLVAVACGVVLQGEW